MDPVVVTRAIVWSLPIIIAIIVGSAGYILKQVINRLLKTIDGLSGSVHELSISLTTITSEVEHLKEMEERHHQENIARMGRNP